MMQLVVNKVGPLRLEMIGWVKDLATEFWQKSVGGFIETVQTDFWEAAAHFMHPHSKPKQTPRSPLSPRNVTSAVQPHGGLPARPPHLQRSPLQTPRAMISLFQDLAIAGNSLNSSWSNSTA